MRPVRVLHVTSTPRGIGGVERLLLDLAPHFDPDRVRVSHCNLFDDQGGAGRFPTALKATGLPYEEITGRRWHHLPSVIAALQRTVRAQRIDILHLHMVHATIVGGAAALLGGAPSVVVTKHYAYRALGNRLLRQLDRTFTNRADAIAAVSSHVRDDLLANGASRARTRVIHNGIDLAAFDPLTLATGESIPSREDEQLIGCVGNLHPIKGHVHLVRAMADVVRKFPAARLILVGEGPAQAPLRELAHSLGVEQAITFAGYRGDVPTLMQQFDIYVQPSLQESFGIVLLEAMAAAVPVIASNVEGIPEIVTDGVTGTLVPVADAGAISAAICALLSSPERREEQGRAGRAEVERRFDIRKTARAYEDLYREVVDAREEGRGFSVRGAGGPASGT